MEPKNSPDQIRIQYNEDYHERFEYEDKLPEGVTEEDMKKEFGKIVWCDFKDCFWNRRVENYQRTYGTVQNNQNYKPINEQEAIFSRICGREDEIVLRFKTVRNTSGGKVDVPYCYVAAKNGKLGHIDFSRLMQSDGSPYGGNIDSQSAGDYGGTETFGAR